MAHETIGEALARSLTRGVEELFDGPGDVLVSRKGLIDVEKLGQLLIPGVYGGAAPAILRELRRDGDSPVLARLAGLLDDGLTLAEALTLPEAVPASAEADADALDAPREGGGHEVYIDGVSDADWFGLPSLEERLQTVEDIVTRPDEHGAPYRGLADARDRTLAKARRALASDPERDWAGWTWTATVTVTDAHDEDETLAICAVRVAEDGHGLEWTRSAPDHRYRVRIEEGEWYTARDRDAVEWLDLHTGRTLRTANPLEPREVADADRIAAPREADRRDRDRERDLRDRPPKGGW